MQNLLWISSELIYNGIMSKIFSITNKAAEEINKILSKAPSEFDSVIVGINNSGCNGYSYKLDFGKSKEILKFDFVEENGAKIYIDPKAIIYLIGSVIDYKTDKLSSRFVFENPNEKSTCGCGESFNI